MEGNTSLSIDGRGHSISGNGITNHFELAKGASLTLGNLSLIHGYAKFGGSIYVSPLSYNVRIRATHVNFTENKGVFGGAVNFGAGQLEISDCLFRGNSAKVSGASITSAHFRDSYAWTGMIAFRDIKIKNTRFESSTTFRDGTVYGGPFSSWSLENCAFEKNSAGQGGGENAFRCGSKIAR